MKKQHHLLRRQLESLSLGTERPPDPEQWGRFLELVDDAYRRVDGEDAGEGAPSNPASIVRLNSPVSAS